MIDTVGYAAIKAKDALTPYQFKRRSVGAGDILIDILYCGVCHSDIHQARDEWGGAIFPMVPGHEIIGRISEVGSSVKDFQVGDIAGVGCFVDSCRTCASCKEGEEQYCENHVSFTYNGTEQDKTTPTLGGYSSNIVVDESYALQISPTLELSGVAPLLCAGITTYSPLRHWNIGRGHRLGVVGLGGLGHMAVKLATSMGAEVTVLSTSPSKEADARRLGAQHFAVSRDEGSMQRIAGSLDFIIDTVAADHDLNALINLLKLDGTLIMVGAPDKPLALNAFSIIPRRRRVAGSMIGGIRETQEMLDYCAENSIVSDVEVIPMQKINEAYERTLKGDVRYRFVIDMKTLSQ